MSTTSHSENSLWQTYQENTMNESLLESEQKQDFIQKISITFSYTIYTLIITLIFIAIITCIIYFVK